MAHEMALAMVNELKTEMAALAREIHDSLKDGKLSARESALLSMLGLRFGTALVTALEAANPALRHDMLYVLEHGTVTLASDLP